MKRIYVVSLLVILMKSGGLFAQDPYFSQYFTSPMTLNPALIGKGNTGTRVLATHRSQWWGSAGAAYETSTVSAEIPLATKKNEKNQLALGIMGLTDASNGGLLKNNYFSAGFAYNVALDREAKQTFGGGLMATYGSRLFDQSKFLYQSQFGSFGFIRSIAANDPIQLPQRNYFDVAAGIHYRAIGKKWDVNLGASAYHLAQPDISAYDQATFSMRMRFNLQASLAKKYKGGDELHFTSLYSSYGNTDLVTIGGIYKYKIQGDHAISRLNGGAMYRIGDSYIAYAAVEAQRWSVGFTYDFIRSDVRTYYNSVQSMEIAFSYFLGSKKKPFRVPAQHFYY
jgi:type IX secretion system PorP/SprF family membrane protein